jgi:membrane-bound lytic murein transglycosylase A|tara:strand:- start:19748 stop:20956 length:1209 start_codon:yes stop_codon:yes gene_type:complete
LNKKILILISFVFFLSGCGQFTTQTPCECEEKESEQKVLEKSEAIVDKIEEIKPYSFLTKVEWNEIKSNLESDHLILAWPAWIQSCSTLINRNEWKPVCETALKIESLTNDKLISYFNDNFNLFQAKNNDGSSEGLITGYYQPVLKGSWTRTKKYNVPLYAPPNDLITVDLSEVYPDLKYKRLRGRIEGNKLIPYLTREEIYKRNFPLQGNELIWLENSVEAFFLEIQGSGVVEFDNGNRTQIGYADQNGHPYRSMGRELIRKGELKRHKVSMQSIKVWAKKNKKKLQKFLNANPSFVFFRELPQGLPGPIGALGVPITTERSVAIDRRYIPLGAPIFLSTTQPNSNEPLRQLMIAQDTGGAINGGVRADFYWGQGKKAGAKAGSMKQSGKIWVILPKEFSF